MIENPHTDSYDLIIQTRDGEGAEWWFYSGTPMTAIESIHKRLKRERKEHAKNEQYGVMVLAYKIVRMRLDRVTGQVTFSTVEEGV